MKKRKNQILRFPKAYVEAGAKFSGSISPKTGTTFYLKRVTLPMGVSGAFRIRTLFLKSKISNEVIELIEAPLDGKVFDEAQPGIELRCPPFQADHHLFVEVENVGGSGQVFDMQVKGDVLFR